MADPHVAIVILNWNNYTDTSDCIDSLQTISYEPMDILLVDNGSTDGSSKRLKEEYPNIDTVLLNENLGFGAGNNVGIREALKHDPDYIWMLNNDTLVINNKHILSNLVDLMEAENKIGVVSPKIMHHPETNDIWFRQGYIDSRSAHAGHEQSRKWFLNPRFGGFITNNNSGSEGQILYNDYIPFCSALIRTEVFEEVGLYPEQYFLYYGDVDYCLRIRNQGYKIGTDTTSKIHHRVSSTSESTRSPTHLYYLARNRQILVRENNDQFGILFYPMFLWWILLNTIDRLRVSDFQGLYALFCGMVDGIQNRTGRGRYP